MKRFLITYEHTDYGYYTTTMEDMDNILSALNYFWDNHAYLEIYSIQEIS